MKTPFLSSPLWLAIIALIALPLASGCGSDDPTIDEPKLECDAGDCEKAECGGDGDCGGGTCRDGVCYALVCTGDDDCEGATCIRGVCVPHECTDDEQCSNGSCIENACVPYECTGDAECTDGSCEDRRCVPFTCESDDECEHGTCVDDACIPHECIEDEDCLNGTCAENACVPHECIIDDDCESGTCVDNACVPHECTDDEHCPNGTCIDYACVDHACTEDDDCPNGTCVDNACIDYECVDDDGCPAGTCVDNACVPYECINHADCDLGRCEANVCVLGPECIVGLDVETLEDGLNQSACEAIALRAGLHYVNDFSITRPISIYGAHTENTIIDANHESRHFTIEEGGSLFIEGLTMRNGSAERGGSIHVKSGASFSASTARFLDNTANKEGGFLYYEGGGEISLKENCVIAGNRVLSKDTSHVYGGAISMVDGRLFLSQVTLEDNRVEIIGDQDAPPGASHGTGYGGAISIRSMNAPAELDVIYSSFVGNSISHAFGESITHRGGAIYARGARVSMSLSEFNDNGIRFDAGCIACNAQGGALFQQGGSLELFGADFKGNHLESRPGHGSLFAGALLVLNVKELDIERSTFVENTVIGGNQRGGGAMYVTLDDADLGPAEHTITRVLFRENSAICDADDCPNTTARAGALNYTVQYGGNRLLLDSVTGANNSVDAPHVNTLGGFGRFLIQETGDLKLRIENSTFSGNRSSSVGSFLAFISNNPSVGSSVDIFNATIVAGDESTLFHLQAPTDASVNQVIRLRNSILSSTADFCSMRTSSKITFGSSGWVVRPSVAAGDPPLGTSCDFLVHPSDIVNNDPGLLPLDDNGGRIPTHALDPASPIINAGEPEGCTDVVSSIPLDQRGEKRTTPNCTPGAYSD